MYIWSYYYSHDVHFGEEVFRGILITYWEELGMSRK